MEESKAKDFLPPRLPLTTLTTGAELGVAGGPAASKQLRLRDLQACRRRRQTEACGGRRAERRLTEAQPFVRAMKQRPAASAQPEEPLQGRGPRAPTGGPGARTRSRCCWDKRVQETSEPPLTGWTGLITTLCSGLGSSCTGRPPDFCVCVCVRARVSLPLPPGRLQAVCPSVLS